MGHIFHSILPWGTMLWMVSKSCPSTSDQVDPKKKDSEPPFSWCSLNSI